MDCQNFKELLDSYLCEELAVETNHTMLSHTERCCSCRCEMAARRQLRESLRRVCSREKMSDQRLEILRARLRSEAELRADSAQTGGGTVRRGRFANLFKMRFLLPAAIVAELSPVIGGAWGLYVLRRGDVNHLGLATEQINALELSGSLVAESAGDHRICAPHFVNASEPAEMPDSISEYDPACVRLDKTAAEGAKGLQLRSAHLCGFGGRKFAHLV